MQCIQPEINNQEIFISCGYNHLVDRIPEPVIGTLTESVPHPNLVVQPFLFLRLSKGNPPSANRDNVIGSGTWE